MTDLTPLSGNVAIPCSDNWFNEPGSTTKIDVTYVQDRIDLTKRERDEVEARSNGRCVYCGDVCRDGKKTVDHITPTSKGGASDISNCVLACHRCNSMKCAGSVEALRHHLAVAMLELPKMSITAIQWAKKQGADISAYEDWGFWFEKSQCDGAAKTRELIDGQMAMAGAKLTLMEKLYLMSALGRGTNIPEYRTPEIDEMIKAAEARSLRARNRRKPAKSAAVHVHEEG